MKTKENQDFLILTFYKQNQKEKLNQQRLEAAAELLGCPYATITMSFANYDYIRTSGKKGLAHYSKSQKDIFNKYYYILP